MLTSGPLTMWAHPALEEDWEDPGHGYKRRAMATKESGGRPGGGVGTGSGLGGRAVWGTPRGDGKVPPTAPPPRPLDFKQQGQPHCPPRPTSPLPTRGTLPPADHPTETSPQHTGRHEDEEAQRQGPPAFSPQMQGRQRRSHREGPGGSQRPASAELPLGNPAPPRASGQGLPAGPTAAATVVATDL